MSRRKKRPTSGKPLEPYWQREFPQRRITAEEVATFKGIVDDLVKVYGDPMQSTDDEKDPGDQG